MSKLLDMIEKRNIAWEGAKAFVEANKDKDGLLTEEQTKQYQEMEQRVMNFSKEIDRLQREEQLDKLMEKPINTPIKEKPRQEAIEEKTGRASQEYKTSMLQALRSNFKQVSNVLQEGVDADGGYLVPEEYDSRLIQVLEDENIVRSLATVITTAGNHKINIAGSSPAAAWIDEGAALSFGEATFSQMLLDAHKLHVAIKVTEELLYDSAFNLESYITEQFGKALANAEEDAFLNGDGNNKPTGIFHESNGGTFLDKVTAIKADDVINLIHALKRPYRKNAVFITNDKTIAQIRKFKDSNGAYIWQPSYQQGEPDRLLGYPIYTSAFAPENAIAFGDFSYYNIGDRGARSFKALTELFAGNGMIGYVAKERVDGKLIVKEAVQILSTQG
ncbi:phage major capsid protein [Carnobacteriaceae bacterium zg-84]|uniref:phage major capsid protein n=1 Tax=Granulicatella sp. zg-84 TaxID=2678503 RepID=UPI0013BFD499|nr:phage major capsid protein [Granulicatella sp. zg-84]NEW66044.1 phage major capsid protein [Granulicatella sp. zg-84]QMI86577.1 phage major capsid protein [Carnobacteriaceae bacterium zg-84]